MLLSDEARREGVDKRAIRETAVEDYHNLEHDIDCISAAMRHCLGEKARRDGESE